ncbi:MAG: ATP-binding protein [Peptostreptococcales bacterium]
MERPSLEKLILYRDILHDEIVKSAHELWKMNKHRESAEIEENYFRIQYLLLKMYPEKFNICWKSHIMDIILKNENTFSLLSEIDGNTDDLRNLVKNDLCILKELYNVDWHRLSCEMGDTETSILCREPHNDEDTIIMNNIFGKEGIVDDKAIEELEKAYREKGCGIFREYIAFKWDDDKGLIGISNVDPIRCQDLIGYQLQKNTLLENTEKLIRGHRVNNILLYGDKGTGKSSLVKAVLNEYSHKKLKIIELTKEQFSKFPALMDQINKRGYKFIIFIDDLSFEDFEVEYKYFKAILEGGIEVRPEHVVIYATSNRRHIIKESWKDQPEGMDDLHRNDAVQEKLSLADRFGITITFQSPNKDLYLRIVEDLAQKENIKMDQEKLFEEALKWEIRYHGRSGRTARQFIDYILSVKDTPKLLKE